MTLSMQLYPLWPICFWFPVSCATIHSQFQMFPWSQCNAWVRWTFGNYHTFIGNLSNIQPIPNKNCGPVFATFAIFCKGGFLEEKVFDENTLNTSFKLCILDSCNVKGSAFSAGHVLFFNLQSRFNENFVNRFYPIDCTFAINIWWTGIMANNHFKTPKECLLDIFIREAYV